MSCVLPFAFMYSVYHLLVCMVVCCRETITSVLLAVYARCADIWKNRYLRALLSSCEFMFCCSVYCVNLSVVFLLKVIPYLFLP